MYTSWCSQYCSFGCGACMAEGYRNGDQRRPMGPCGSERTLALAIIDEWAWNELTWWMNDKRHHWVSVCVWYRDLYSSRTKWRRKFKFDLQVVHENYNSLYHVKIKRSKVKVIRPHKIQVQSALKAMNRLDGHTVVKSNLVVLLLHKEPHTENVHSQRSRSRGHIPCTWTRVANGQPRELRIDEC